MMPTNTKQRAFRCHADNRVGFPEPAARDMGSGTGRCDARLERAQTVCRCGHRHARLQLRSARFSYAVDHVLLSFLLEHASPICQWPMATNKVDA